MLELLWDKTLLISKPEKDGVYLTVLVVSFYKSLLGFLGSDVCCLKSLTIGSKMSDPILAKLLAADSDLEAQEAKLIAKLEAIQAQRASLQSVMEIFDPDKTMAAGKQVVIASAPIADVATDLSAENSAKVSPKQKVTQSKDQPTQSLKSANLPTSTRRGWQKYMRNEHGQTPLPAVVSGILQARPKKVFEIAEVVDAIVVQTIPHTDRQGARNRISNILAEGARKNQWHRHESGRYSFSK